MWLKSGAAERAKQIFWASVALYTIVLFASRWAIEHHSFVRPVVVSLALVPVVPILGVATGAVMRYFALDELQRRIQAEGIMFAFVLTAVFTLAYGFLEGVAAVPKFPTFGIWPLLAVGWAGGSLAAKARYR